MYAQFTADDLEEQMESPMLEGFNADTQNCITFPSAPGGTGEGKVCGKNLENAWAFHNPTGGPAGGVKSLYVANWDNVAKRWSWTTNNAWIFRSNGTLSCGNRVANKRLVLWDDREADDPATATAFFGLGINNGTLRYQVPDGGAMHRFFTGPNERMTVHPHFVDVKPDLHLRSNLFFSFNGDWNGPKEANPWIFHAPHDLRDGGDLKTLYIASWNKARKDWSWGDSRAWMFRSNGTFSATNRVANKILVIYDDGVTDDVNTAVRFYGFGINGGTLRHQVPDGGFHRFFTGPHERMVVGPTVSANVDLHAKSNFIMSSPLDWNTRKESNTWIFHTPHDLRDGGDLKTMYIASWSKAKKDWSWVDNRAWMFRSNGTFSAANGLLANKKLVLWDDNVVEDVVGGTAFYGFGINGSTLRYQVPAGHGNHTAYVGTKMVYNFNANRATMVPVLINGITGANGSSLQLNAPIVDGSTFSLGFGALADDGTNLLHRTGMGLVPGGKMFGDTKGTLITHIRNDYEASWYSDGANKLFGIRGGSGDIAWNGNNFSVKNGATFRSTGRMHIFGEELLYLLNKSGVIIGKEWGGNGNLHVQGDLRLDGMLRNKFGDVVYDADVRGKTRLRFGLDKGASILSLEEDGNVVLLREGKPIWQTRTSVSDLRRKTNVVEYRGGLEVIQKMRPITFEYLPEVNAPGVYIGFGAQELETIFPYAVQRIGDDLLVSKEDVVPALVSAVQDLSSQLEAEKAARASLEERLARIEAALESVKCKCCA